MQLGLRLEPPGTAGLTVWAVLHEAIHTRLGFEQTIGGEGLGGIVDRAFVDVDTAPKGPNDTLFARFGMPGAGLPPNQTLRVQSTGVYPLDVQLRSGSAVIDHFVTWVVYVSNARHNTSAIPEPLSVSWVWSMQAPPAFGPGNTPPSATTLQQFSTNGRLGRIASLLEDARGVPLT